MCDIDWDTYDEDVGEIPPPCIAGREGKPRTGSESVMFSMSDGEAEDRGLSNSVGRWYWISNEKALELRTALRAVQSEIPTGLGNEKWGPETRALFEKLAEAFDDVPRP